MFPSAFYSPSPFLVDYTALFSTSLSSSIAQVCFEVSVDISYYYAFTQVRMQALKCFSVLAFENPQVSMTLVNGECNAAAAGLMLTFCLAEWEWLGALSLCSVCWWRIVTTDFCEDVTEGQAHWNATHVSQMVIVFRNWGNSEEFSPCCVTAPFLLVPK